MKILINNYLCDCYLLILFIVLGMLQNTKYPKLRFNTQRKCQKTLFFSLKFVHAYITLYRLNT